MFDFLNGIARSKTALFAITVAAFGWIAENVELFAPLMSPQHFGKFTTAIGIAVLIMRAITTDSLAHKGSDNPQARSTDQTKANDGPG